MLFLHGQKRKQSVYFAALSSLNGTAECDVNNTGDLPHLDQTQKHPLDEQFLRVFCGHHLGVMFPKKILDVVLRGFLISRIWFQKVLYNIWPKYVLLFGMIR